MFPRNPSDNFQYGDTAHVEAMRQRQHGGATFGFCSDDANLFFGELVVWMAHTAANCSMLLRQAVTLAVRSAAFTSHVVQVVLACAEKQMIWSDARPIVAVMTNVYSGGWYLSSRQLKGCAVRMSTLTAKTKMAVSVLGRRPGPDPAASAKRRMDWTVLVNFGPEAIGRVARASCVCARTRTELRVVFRSLRSAVVTQACQSSRSDVAVIRAKSTRPSIDERRAAAFAKFGRVVSNHIDLLSVCVARGALGADYTVAPLSLYEVSWP